MNPTTEALVALRDPEQVEKSLLRLEAYRAAAVRANTIEPGFTIASADDNDQATVDRDLIKSGIKALDSHVKERGWLDAPTRAIFEALEGAEKRIKNERDRLRGMLSGRVKLIDDAMTERVRAERIRVAAEEAEKRKRDEAAAQAAREAAASESPDAPPPPPAETFVAPAAVPTYSKVGNAKSVVKESPVKCEMWLDPALPLAEAQAAAIREIARHWPHLLDLDTVKAKAEFAALKARGQVEKPSEAGTVIGGIRFFVTLGVSG